MSRKVLLSVTGLPSRHDIWLHAPSLFSSKHFSPKRHDLKPKPARFTASNQKAHWGRKKCKNHISDHTWWIGTMWCWPKRKMRSKLTREWLRRSSRRTGCLWLSWPPPILRWRTQFWRGTEHLSWETVGMVTQTASYPFTFSNNRRWTAMRNLTAQSHGSIQQKSRAPCLQSRYLAILRTLTYILFSKIQNWSLAFFGGMSVED